MIECLLEEISSAGAERVLFTQDTLWLDTHNHHIKTFTLDDARRMLLAEMVANWVALPLEIRINLPAETMNSGIFNQAFDILRFASVMGVRVSDSYWMSPQEYLSISDIEPIAEGNISTLLRDNVVNFPGNDAVVISKVTDIVRRIPVLVEPQKWFDSSKAIAEQNHHPKEAKTDHSSGGDRRRNQFDRIWKMIGIRPPIVLCPWLLDANRHLMENQSIGGADYIHHDMLLDAAGTTGLRNFLIATLKCPSDPLSVIGDHPLPSELSADGYVWNWTIWYDYIKGLNNVSQS